jgi:hypothetical protein
MSNVNNPVLIQLWDRWVARTQSLVTSHNPLPAEKKEPLIRGRAIDVVDPSLI